MKTSEKIIEYIKKNRQATGAELADFLDLTDRAVRKQLKSLLEQGLLEKIGSSPKVFYKIKSSPLKPSGAIFTKDVSGALENNFYNITPSGEELVGKLGFVSWCMERGFDLQKKSQEFFKTMEKYRKIRKNDLIDATNKLKKVFKDGADKLFYYDFYSLEVFGKTKTGQKLLYAKQSEDKRLMKEIAEQIRPSLIKLIKSQSVDAVAYVPPTVPRKLQFMKVLARELKLDLPEIKILKVSSKIRVPQKTLKKLSDRIENADKTFVVEKHSSFKKILLIDDAVGSGASINQIAQKIKERGIAKEVIGFAVTGSLNDFDVISEV